MSQTERYIGTSFIATWNGTKVSSDFTDFAVNRASTLEDLTAGNDADEWHVPRVKGATMSMTTFDTGGTTATAISYLLREGQTGTLSWGPQGTTTGKPKHSCKAVINGSNMSHPMGGAQLSVDWTKRGAWIAEGGTAVW